MDQNALPRIPVGDWVSDGIDWLTDNAAVLFDAFSAIMSFLIDGFSEVLLSVPGIIMLVILALLGWFFRSPKFAIGSALGFLLVMCMRQWDTMLETMSLVLIATLSATILAVPLGIWAAKSNTASAIIRPIMDFMQTMPAFVYLIPAVTFFSIGVVPGIFSTIIFALPPGVRMTELGIRQVDSETVEAGKVIAGMVGADGLGKEVVSAISTLDIAQGVEAGLAVVILAVFLDRLTAALGSLKSYPASILNLVRK